MNMNICDIVHCSVQVDFTAYCNVVPVLSHSVCTYSEFILSSILEYSIHTGSIEYSIQFRYRYRYCTSMNTLLYCTVQIYSMQYNSSIQVGAKLVNTPRRRCRYGINFL